MKKRILLLCLSITIIGLSVFFGVSEVSALNYTPSVEIGDELIWSVEDQYINSTEKPIVYHKRTVIDIYDSGDQTYVKASAEISEDNVEYTSFGGPYIIGTLADYSVDVEALWDTEILVPGTKIGNYAEAIKSMFGFYGDNLTIQSIKNGYGVQLDIELTDFPVPFQQIVEYDRKGLMIFMKTIHQEDEQYPGEVFYYRTTQLYSINGKPYNSIPGFSLVVLGIISISALMVLYRMKRSKFCR